MSAALLQVRGLTKHFGGIAAVENVDLELQEGMITALAGPNGAGKTTLFNLITGNIPPDSGSVALAGRPVTGLAPHRIAQLGIRPQLPRPAPVQPDERT